MARPEKIRLGDLLIQQGLLTEAQLKLALEEQKLTGRKLGRIFVDGGYVSEEQISQALARQLRIPFFDLKTFNVKPDLTKLLPEAQARRFRAIPLEDRGSALLVGLVDPTDLLAYDEIVRLVRRDIELAVVTESQLLVTIDRLYRRTEEISGLAKELQAELGDMPIEFGELLGLTPGAEDAPVVKLLQTVFEEALRTRASDIHIEPQEARLRIRFRIDGVLHIQTEADPKIATAVALRLKLMSGLDISEKRLPQDGRFNIKVRNNPVDVRISTMPTQYGESVVMRILAQSNGILGLDNIHMPAHILDRLRHAIHRPSGIVLVTGPTGSGKTTTLYAALSELNTTEKKVITVEDPVEYRLPGINQVQVHEKIDLSFDRVLRTALRQDPDIILVGEMRDQMTAEIGMRAAMTGHLVLSTLHTNDAISTPIRLLDMGVPRYMVALSLQLVLAQRLVRVICDSCAAPHVPEPHEREWLRYELGEQLDGHHFKKGTGCPHCGGTGYQGRTGVWEMLEMTSEVVEATNQDDPSIFMQAARKQMGGNTLRRDAVRLARQGRTTIDEAMRVASQTED
ncbi:MAG: GspE/PulE family protein [Pseudomonadota bacterium]|jgi:MSHA biogenesis protein MshE|uniref:MSHA biogenesis protein MshE n=1 Tax=Azospira oryzae TaxID=146939 RepID=A0ABY0INT8_9RHOO|nr:MSHA biogenesis protein MshE [Azospira oryzae]TLS18654.1 MAG: MSHA biogenesis protein MshE [Betaproteobacteria bacterium]BBN89931.1 MSHA biogenesis protein MshE [Azospira sp. I09]